MHGHSCAESDDFSQSCRRMSEEERHNEQRDAKPASRWFVHTAFPLIAGTFGPLATAFNICALTQRWSTDATIDLSWRLGLSTTSLVLGLVANISLLLAMTERVPTRFADPISLLGWNFASLMLIAPAIALSKRVESRNPAGPPFSQAYYYGLIAAGIYFCISALMTVTIFSTRTGRRARYFKLNEKQRTLMLQTIVFLLYLFGGAAVYSRVEGWNFLDAVYWADFTLLTIGLGDISPATHLGRSLLFPYATGGIISMGLLVQSIRSMLLQKGEKKFTTRMIEKERKRILNQIRGGNKRLASESEARGEDMQRQGFNLMRKVQNNASRKDRWTFFLTAAGAWSSLWVIGAAIFWRTERSQDWSYFESLYFCYVSLMTIGFGTLYPQSNSGRPLYVFWSLLGAPVITILVSSMEDTIARQIKRLTLRIGDITILPGETGSEKSRMRNLFSDRKGKQIDQEASSSSDARYSFSGSQEGCRCAREPSQGSNLRSHHSFTGGGENGRSPLSLCSHPRCILYSIGKMVRKLICDRREPSTSQYTYEEWVYFLKLLKASGLEEDGFASMDLDDHEHSRLQQEQDDGEDCYWLSDHSPLRGGKDEAQWILERLCLAQERILQKQRHVL